MGKSMDMILPLLLSLALHAYHSQCHFYHHCFVAYITLYHFEGRISALLRQSLSYFIAVTVLGDMQQVREATWVMCFPVLIVLLGTAQYTFSINLTHVICPVAVAGLHCLMGVLY